jgi:type II secretory pathway component GspD/PulD (secretin)
MQRVTTTAWALAVLAVAMWTALPVGAQTATPTQPSAEPGAGGYAGGVAGRVNVEIEDRTGVRSGEQPATAEPSIVEPSGAASGTPAGPAPSGAGADTTVRAIKGSKPVTVEGSATFDPILAKEVEYPELPDVGDPIDHPPTPAPVTEFLTYVAESTGWNVVSSPGLSEMTVQIMLKGVRPKAAMEMLQFSGIYYEFDPTTQTLFVMPVEEYLQRRYGALEQAEFRVSYADVTDVEQVLKALMSKTGRLISDPRTGHILVWDTAANIDQMEAAIRRIDVPLEPLVIPLKYVLAEDLLESVEAMLSERGLVQADPRGNTLVVTDLPSRQAEIVKVVEALDHRIQTRSWRLDYVEAKTVLERLEAIIPEEGAVVTMDDDLHQVSVTGPPERLAEVDELIKAWDVPPRQVQIEAFIVTANSTVTRNFGIDWAYFDDIGGTAVAIFSGDQTANPLVQPSDGQRISIGRLPYQLPLRNPLTNQVITDVNGQTVVDPDFRGNHIAAVLDYLNQQGELRILQRPRVTVHDGQTATFERKTRIPYQNVGSSVYGPGTAGADFDSNYVIPLQVEFIDVGTILEVEPRITGQGTILLDIAAEDSSAEVVNVVAGDRVSTIPQKSENTTQTQVLVHDGQTIVIGGLRSDSYEDQETRVPGFGEVPLLGRLFKKTEKRREERELLIFLTRRSWKVSLIRRRNASRTPTQSLRNGFEKA